MKKLFERQNVLMIVLFVAAVLIIIPPGASLAAEKGIEAGALKIFPALELKESYNSNIYLAPADEESDFITTVTPSLRFLLPIEDFFLQLLGEGSFVRYQDTSEEDNDVYRVSGAVGAKFPGGLGFSVADTFTHYYFPTQTEFDIAEYYDVNQVYGTVDYTIRQAFKIKVEYYNYHFVYDLSDDLDRDENTFAATLFWKFLPKTSALVEIDYSDLAYAVDEWTYKDNQVYQGRVGLTWAMTGKSTGEVRLGYQKKDYTDEAVEDKSNVVATAKVGTAFDKYTFFDVELLRATVESDYQLNPHYLSTRLSADLTRRFTPKISGTAGLSYRMDQYPNETTEGGQTAQRSDDSIGGKLSLKFQMFRWLMLQASYSIENRESNLDAFDFDVTRAMISAKAEF